MVFWEGWSKKKEGKEKVERPSCHRYVYFMAG
jgi:hypothetical protein